jgi:hypothetical protein
MNKLNELVAFFSTTNQMSRCFIILASIYICGFSKEKDNINLYQRLIVFLLVLLNLFLLKILNRMGL